MNPERYLARLRALCKKLPETGERLSWGHPNFTAGGRMFAALGDYGKRGCIGIATSHEEQTFLVEDARFSVAPYVGKQGWVVAWMDQEPKWPLLATLLRNAHARILAKSRRKPVRKKTKKPTR